MTYIIKLDWPLWNTVPADVATVVEQSVVVVVVDDVESVAGQPVVVAGQLLVVDVVAG